MNFYDTLGVEPTSTSDQIRSAYRGLAKESHPDLGGDSERFRELTQAYETLSDSHRRKLYDAWLQAPAHNTGAGFADQTLQDDMQVAAVLEHLDVMTQQATHSMKVGLFWAGGAAAISLFSYEASKGGGHYVVLWGPVIFGAWRAIKSFEARTKLIKARRDIEASLRRGLA